MLRVIDTRFIKTGLQLLVRVQCRIAEFDEVGHYHESWTVVGRGRNFGKLGHNVGMHSGRV